MFNAVGKFFRAVWYLATFRMNKASEVLRSNPGVVSATYDRVIADKRDRLIQYKDAIASMIALEETKKGKLETLTEEIEKLSRLKAGAAAKARKLVEKYNGDSDAVKGDADYAKCQSAFRDFSSTLAEKQARADELEGDIQELMKNLNEHKIQLQSHMRDMEKLREEKHDAVADILSAQRRTQGCRHADRFEQRSDGRRAARTSRSTSKGESGRSNESRIGGDGYESCRRRVSQLCPDD